MTERRWIAPLEAIVSGIVLILVVAMFFNYLDAYLTFFGEVPHPTPEEATRFKTYLYSAVGAVAATFILCAMRRGEKAYAWHLVVGLIVAGGGTLFAVPAAV